MSGPTAARRVNVQRLSWVLLCGALLSLAVAVLVGRNVWVIATSLSALLATGLDLWTQRRAIPGHRKVGERTEQDYVIDSYHQAVERDLTPAQWMASYAKRAEVDA